MKYYNYHTHTNYCDGSATPEKYIAQAKEMKMSALGFSAHSPLPFINTWSLKADMVNDYLTAIDNLKNIYIKDIAVFKGLEIDYIPGMSYNFREMIKVYKLDYTIGSVHLVKVESSDKLWFIDGPANKYSEGLKNLFNNDVKLAVTNYFKQLREMIVNEKPDIIGHLDKIKMNNKEQFFSTQDSWYRKLISDTLKTIKNSIVEINTRGLYTGKYDEFYPAAFVIEECFKLDIPVTISSDAHNPADLTSYYDEAVCMLKTIGYKGVSVFKGNKWQFEKFT
ncbi:MAG: histidinol-phosphatase [Bacteroidales bacterium]|nr:histidinol-phosphatase [Bacteroidales bacterium]